MVCRNAKYAEDAKNEIIEASQNQDVHVHILDMSEPKSIFKFAEEFKEKNSSLNCLVNNAGYRRRKSLILRPWYHFLPNFQVHGQFSRANPGGLREKLCYEYCGYLHHHRSTHAINLQV